MGNWGYHFTPIQMEFWDPTYNWIRGPTLIKKPEDFHSVILGLEAGCSQAPKDQGRPWKKKNYNPWKNNLTVSPPLTPGNKGSPRTQKPTAR